MADESDLERTEPASPRRIEQAREEGQVAHSRELATFLVLITGVAVIWLMSGWLAARVTGIVRRGLAFDHDAAFDTAHMGADFVRLAVDGLLAVMPIFVAVLIAVFAAPILLGGFVVSPKALKLDLARLDPLKGVQRMFSLNSLAELVKAVLKALLIGGVAFAVVWHYGDAYFALILQPLDAGLAELGRLLALGALLIVAALALVAGIDVPWQLWQYYKKLRMTKEEARREAKETEGDPQVKARIRSQQREVARRRMMSEVPKADVVVTNPTHYSVALKYDAARMGAPRVVAKGAGEVALKIREIAREAEVPLLEAPPLARALHRHCELGEEVPGTLYAAVAEVLAYVYQLSHYLAHGGLPPAAPAALPVPADMDPGAA